MQLAVDVLEWPGMNAAFLFSFILTSAAALAVFPYAKRRPAGKPTTWGEAMLGATFAFGLMFVAFGVVPHQWIDHADKDLGWTRAKVIYGPFDILKPESLGGWFPLTLTYEFVRDNVTILIHVWYFALIVILWKKWQTRGTVTSTELEPSSFGRPLVKKG